MNSRLIFPETSNAAYHVTISDSSEEELNMAVCIAVIAKEVLISAFNHSFFYPQAGLNVEYFLMSAHIFEQMPLILGILVVMKPAPNKSNSS